MLPWLLPNQRFHFTAIIIFVIPCYELTFKREYPACWTCGGGGVHHSLLPPGPGSSLAFICTKSECPSHARGGGGGAGVSNDWCIMWNSFQKLCVFCRGKVSGERLISRGTHCQFRTIEYAMEATWMKTLLFSHCLVYCSGE